MSTAFTFDREVFRQRYPAFTEEKLPDGALDALWESVVSLLANSEGLFPWPESKTPAIVYAALCHLATLQTADSDAPGRVASASQGSVSVSFDLVQGQGDAAQWWNLTKCGALFWVLTKPYRMGLKLYRGSNYHPWG